MGERTFLTFRPPDCDDLDGFSKRKTMDEIIRGLKIGESARFPIEKKGSVTGRVSDLNKVFSPHKHWHTKTDRPNFQIEVIRDK